MTLKEVQLRIEYLEGRYDRVWKIAAEWATEIGRLIMKGWRRDSLYLRTCREKQKCAGTKASEIASEIMELCDLIKADDPDLDADTARWAYNRGYRSDPLECKNCGADSYDGFCTSDCKAAWEQVHNAAFVDGHPRDTSGDRFERDKIGEQQ